MPFILIKHYLTPDLYKIPSTKICVSFAVGYIINEPRHAVSNNVVCAISKGSDQPAHTRCWKSYVVAQITNTRRSYEELT